MVMGKLILVNLLKGLKLYNSFKNVFFVYISMYLFIDSRIKKIGLFFYKCNEYINLINIKLVKNY